VRFQGDYITVGLPAMRLQGFLTFAELVFRIYALGSLRVSVRPGHMNHFVFLLKRETKRGAIGVIIYWATYSQGKGSWAGWIRSHSERLRTIAKVLRKCFLIVKFPQRFQEQIHTHYDFPSIKFQRHGLSCDSCCKLCISECYVRYRTSLQSGYFQYIVTTELISYNLLT
jgi:hypothetical protein